MMRVQLEGIALTTTVYAENGDIHFTCFTDGDDQFQALSTALEDQQRVLALQRGGEEVAVRVSDYQVWPPHARRMDGSMHRHDIHLAFAGTPSLS